MTHDLNDSASLRDKAADLCSKLSTEEKIALTAGRDPWSTVPVERLDIPWIWVADGPHGLRRAPKTTEMGYGDQLPATCFPTASALAASWDRNLLEKVGETLADECASQSVDVLLGPGVNIKRSPLAGRNFEYFSEDPLLSGEMGAAYIKGLQKKGIGACLKHFAANNIETRRMHINAAVDERTFREIYLKPFEIAVKKGNPWTVMACYNRVQGEYGTQNTKLLRNVLREEWGSDAIVMTDWDAIVDRVEALRAGLHLQMPGGESPFSLSLIKEALEKGAIEERLVDELVTDILTLVLKCKASELKPEPFDPKQHHKLAREIGSQCITLLKNDGNILPIDPELFEKQQGRKIKIALLGEFAEDPRYQGNGSSEVKPTQIDNLRQVLNDEYGHKAEILYARGYNLNETESPNDEKALELALSMAKNCDVALIAAGLPLSYESEGIDRKHLNLPDSHNRLIKAVSEVQKNCAVVLSNGSAVVMPWIDNVPSVLETWVLGQAGASAVADVLFGAVNPSGKLGETFPMRLEDNPTYFNFPGEEGDSIYGERMFVGYRYYDKKKITPLFPFGHGLSYTTFGYSDFNLSTDKLKGDETLALSFTIENTGNAKGKEVVQLYISDSESTLIRPGQELKDFVKVELDPGEKKEISFELNREALSFYDSLRKRWIAESGEFKARLGSSSRDIRLEKTFSYEGTEEVPIVLDEYCFISTLWKHGETRKALCESVPRWLEQFTPPGKTIEEAKIDEFLIEHPMIKLPHFTGGEITFKGVMELVDKCRSFTYSP